MQYRTKDKLRAVMHDAAALLDSSAAPITAAPSLQADLGGNFVVADFSLALVSAVKLVSHAAWAQADSHQPTALHLARLALERSLPCFAAAVFRPPPLDSHPVRGPKQGQGQRLFSCIPSLTLTPHFLVFYWFTWSKALTVPLAFKYTCSRSPSGFPFRQRTRQ